MRIITLIIAVMMLTIMLSSCNNSNTDDNIDKGNETSDPYNQTEQTTNGYEDELGEFNFGGYEFRMFSSDNPNYYSHLNVEVEIGEVFNDAVYQRNRIIEDRFNFIFKEIMSTGAADAYQTMLMGSIMAGDNEYDIFTLHMMRNFVFAQEGLIHPINALPYINTEKLYWDQGLNSDLTVKNKMYFIVGAYDLSSYEFTHILLFNKSMVNNLGLDNPYELVKSNKWTFDKFSEMAKTATVDINGDGVFTQDDQYGFLSLPKHVLPNFWIAAGLKSMAKDENDVPYSEMGTAFFNQVFNRTYEMTWDMGLWYVNNGAQSALDTMFAGSYGLFMGTTPYYANPLRAMETDFGIIPYPKYSESQENYHARIEGLATACVPITADEKALERTSVILEAMACESAKIVLPAYYDVALKVRNTRDNESSEMLDIIFANRVLDLGDGVWFAQVRDGIFAPMFRENNRNLASKLESLESIIKNLSDEAVAAFDKLIN